MNIINSKIRKEGYSLKDVAVIQAPIGYINHRADVNPFISVCEREVYPIFVAPMSTVTNQKNYKVWIDNKVTPVIPRSVAKSEYNPDGITFEERIELSKETFVSVSLEEAGKLLDFEKFKCPHYICIDIANGTLESLYDVCEDLKFVHKSNIVIMTGNVANPKAYQYYNDIGIDYMRVSVGSGSCCTTACAVGVYYPMATLLDDIYCEKQRIRSKGKEIKTKVIADGGIADFDDIQKALALGADAVMCGEVFAKSNEACGDILYSESMNTVTNGIYLNEKEYFESRIILSENPYIKYKPAVFHMYRNYYGMSTPEAQKLCGGTGQKTTEGISRYVEVEYHIEEWIHRMDSYLRSNMTYTNCKTIKEINEYAEVIVLGGVGDTVYRKKIQK